VGAGEIFGELALIDGRPRTASAIAASQVEILEITRRQFDEAVGGLTPEVSHRIEALIAYVREIPPRRMWPDGRMPDQASAYLAKILPLLEGDKGAEVAMDGEFLKALYARLVDYARARLPS
jgi:CRP-like cAMP-binding protein